MWTDFIEVYPYRDGWTWDCRVCFVSGDDSPDQVNAEFEAEGHYEEVHVDKHPWEVPC